jgi:hypothetical protein
MAPSAPQKLTTARIQQVALYAIATLAIAAGTALAIAALAAAVSTPVGCIAIPLFILGGALLAGAYRIQDYKNPAALAEIKKKAEAMSFDALLWEHGIKNLLQHKILSVAAIQEKFKKQPLTLSQVLEKYNPDDLIKNQIVTPAHGTLLKYLKNRCAEENKAFNKTKKTIERTYRKRTGTLQNRLRRATGILDSTASVMEGVSAKASINPIQATKAVSGGLGLAGALIGDEAYLDSEEQQEAYDEKMAAATRAHKEVIDALEKSYSDFKRARA